MSPRKSESLFGERRNFRPIEPDSSGDFDSPTLKTLREAWNEFLDGTLEESDLVGILHQVGANLERHIDSLQEQVDKGYSDVRDSVFATVCEAFLSHLQAVKLMLREFDTDPDDPDYQSYFEKGYEMAQAATNRMMSAHDQTMQAIENAAWVNCRECGTRNPGTNSHCNQCRAALPLRLEITLDGARIVYLGEEISAGKESDGGHPNPPRCDFE